MKIVKLRVALGVAAVLALTLTALASAHPSLYDIVGKVAKSPEIQTLTVDATGGTYKPSAGARTIPYNAPAWQVQDALGADAAIGRAANGQANVLVTGDPGGPYTLRYQGSRATTDQALIVPNSTGLTGGTATASAVTTIEGGLPDVTYENNPGGFLLPNDILRAAIANDGYAMTFTESNGLATNGWLNLRFMPGGYRRPAAPGVPMTESEWLNWPRAQTGIQSHATCQNVPTLNTEAAILALAVERNRSVLELRPVAEDVLRPRRPSRGVDGRRHGRGGRRSERAHGRGVVQGGLRGAERRQRRLRPGGQPREPGHGGGRGCRRAAQRHDHAAHGRSRRGGGHDRRRSPTGRSASSSRRGGTPTRSWSWSPAR